MNWTIHFIGEADIAISIGRFVGVLGMSCRIVNGITPPNSLHTNRWDQCGEVHLSDHIDLVVTSQ